MRRGYGWREPASPGQLLRRLRGQLGAARRELRAEGLAPSRRRRALALVAGRQVARLLGALLGSRADLLPARLRAALSLERREGFQALEWGSAIR